MKTSVPFTAFCPDCNGHRTFTIIGSIGHPDTGRLTHKIGCCVCGTSEREALVAVSARLADDRDSLGEISARLNTLDGEVAELRDELHTRAMLPRWDGTRVCQAGNCTNLRADGLLYCNAHRFSRRSWPSGTDASAGVG